MTASGPTRSKDGKIAEAFETAAPRLATTAPPVELLWMYSCGTPGSLPPPLREQAVRSKMRDALLAARELCSRPLTPRQLQGARITLARQRICSLDEELKD